MGLFGGKKIYVSSSVYNLAGDENDRPNFLKSTVFSAVMNPYNAYIGETVVTNYLTGPGIMQRSFFNYAARKDLAGLPTISIRNALPIDPEIVEPLIPVAASPVGLETHVQSSELTDGDFSYWAEKWIMENNPTENGTEWAADYNENTNMITVQFVGGGTSTFSGTNFDKNKQFVIAHFYQSVPNETLPLETGALTTGVLTTPSTTGYSLTSSNNTGSIVTHNQSQTQTVEKVYSNGDPTTTDTTFPNPIVNWNEIEHIWNRTDFIGGNGVSPETSNLEKWLHIFEGREIYNDTTTDVAVNDMGGGETETVTTTLTGDFLRPLYNWREDTQETVLEAIVGDAQMYIYELGTGEPTLDALTAEQIPGGAPEYYPFIPIRLDNKSILDPKYDNTTGSGLYNESKLAYRRATKSQSLLKLVEQVEDNPDLADIDFCYLQWGVSVNVIEPAGRTYMYGFFKGLINQQNTTSATITAYKSSITTYETKVAEMNAWVAAQIDSGSSLYGTPKPNEPRLADPETTTVRLIADHPQLGGFDNRYTWVNIEEKLFNGVGKPGAVQGDIWFEAGETVSWTVQTGFTTRQSKSLSSLIPRTLDEMILWKQTGPNTYSKLSVWGMVHNNFIYGGKSVRTTLAEGVADLEPSVFIIPYHAPSVAALGIKDYTQLATANTWLTFNSYQVVKKKWYETFLGMLLIVIAIIVVAALIAPAAIGGMSGALGTNAAVGASLGLTGTASIVAGAVTNAIAGVIIAQAISVVSIAVFGEKWGAIIAAVVSFAVSFGMSSGFSNMSLSTMMNPQTLLQFSSALANGYAGFVQAEIGEMQTEMVENQSAYDKAKDDLEQLMRDMGLVNDLQFDPMTLTDLGKGNGRSGELGTYVPESLDQFISRTTMTGSDVVDITLSMVSDYSDLQLTLPKS